MLGFFVVSADLGLIVEEGPVLQEDEYFTTQKASFFYHMFDYKNNTILMFLVGMFAQRKISRESGKMKQKRRKRSVRSKEEFY